MIIDDEPDIRTYLMAILEDNGFSVCTVLDNTEVKKGVLSEKPDLIILDIMMPQRSGISIYKELRTCSALNAIPVALISGMMPEKDFIEKEFPALVDDKSVSPPDGYIEKPVQVEKLVALVTQLVEERG